LLRSHGAPSAIHSPFAFEDPRNDRSAAISRLRREARDSVAAIRNCERRRLRLRASGAFMTDCGYDGLDVKWGSCSDNCGCASDRCGRCEPEAHPSRGVRRAVSARTAFRASEKELRLTAGSSLFGRNPIVSALYVRACYVSLMSIIERSFAAFAATRRALQNGLRVVSFADHFLLFVVCEHKSFVAFVLFNLMTRAELNQLHRAGNT
jgi:hypothetical protein